MEWVLGIFGVIAAAIGAVILATGELRVVLGDLSWQVGDNIAPVWGYVLLIVGAILAVGMLVFALIQRRDIRDTGHTTTPHPV